MFKGNCFGIICTEYFKRLEITKLVKFTDKLKYPNNFYTLLNIKVSFVLYLMLLCNEKKKDYVILLCIHHCCKCRLTKQKLKNPKRIQCIYRLSLHPLNLYTGLITMYAHKTSLSIKCSHAICYKEKLGKCTISRQKWSFHIKIDEKADFSGCWNMIAFEVMT